MTTISELQISRLKEENERLRGEVRLLKAENERLRVENEALKAHTTRFAAWDALRRGSK